MKSQKIGIITLAVTLISLGFILLARNFTNLNTALMLSVLWPSIIILFGIEIVIAKLITERKKEGIRMTVDGLSVVILVIIIVITSIVTSIGVIPIKFNGLSILGNNNWLYAHSSEYSYSYEFEATDKDKIEIDNSYGKVQFKKISGDMIIVNAVIKFNHNDDEKADTIAEEIVQIDEDNNNLSVNTNVQNKFYRGEISNLDVSYIVEIPEEVEIDVVSSNESSPININGINIFGNNNWLYSYSSGYSFDYEFEASDKNKIYIENSHGNVEVKKASGEKIVVNAMVRFDHNDQDKADEISTEIVQIDDNKGSLSIKTTNREKLRINDMGNLQVSYVVEIPEEIDVQIVNSYGNISVTGNAKQVDIDSKHSDVSLHDIKGSVNVDNSYGYVTVDKAVGSVNIFNKHGRIEVYNIENDVIIENSYDQVMVQNINGDVEIINSHDLVVSENITGDVDIRSSYSDIRILGAEQGVKIINKHGDIRYESENVIKKYLDIKNEYGDVRITIPKEQEANFKSYVKYGDIYNDFELDIDENTNTQSIMETIGKGNVRLDIETTHGDIHLNGK